MRAAVQYNSRDTASYDLSYCSLAQFTKIDVLAYFKRICSRPIVLETVTMLLSNDQYQRLIKHYLNKIRKSSVIRHYHISLPRTVCSPNDTIVRL